MRALALAAVLAVPAPAFAMIDPPPCDPAGDTRIRCADFSPTQVYRIPVRFGAHVSILFAEEGTILDPASAMLETLSKDGDGQAKKLKEWQGVWDANSMQLQPLKSPMPSTSMTVPVKMRGGKVLNHAFQLDALDDNGGSGARLYTEADMQQAEVAAAAAKGLPEDKRSEAAAQARARMVQANANTIMIVRFSYAPQYDPPAPKPTPIPAANGEGPPRPVASRSDRFAGTLRQEAFYNSTGYDRNWSYVWRGDAETMPTEISDNGLDTYLRFDVAFPVPNIYGTENNACDGAKTEVLLTRDNPNPGEVRVYGSYSVLCLRRGGGGDGKQAKVTQIVNCRRLPQVCGLTPEYTQLPYGTNPLTGTISPNVVRVRRASRAR